MKSLYKKVCLLFAVVIFSLSGCAGTPVTIKSFPVQDVALEKGRPIKAEACGFQLLLVIPIMINGRLESAFNELKEKAGSDYIAQVSIEEYWRYAFIGTVYCTSLEAIAYTKAVSK